MIYIIMERKNYGNGDMPIHVLTSERKCRTLFSEILNSVFENEPTATQAIIKNGIRFNFDNGNYLSYETIEMEVTK